MNFQGCTTIHTLQRPSIPYNNSKIPSFTAWIDMNFQDCSTINKLLGHSTDLQHRFQNPTFNIFNFYAVFRIVVQYPRCGDIQFPTVILKFHLSCFGLIWICSIVVRETNSRAIQVPIVILNFHLSLWMFTNFQGCTTIHKLWGRSFPYNNSEIPSFTFWINMNF